MKPCWRLPPTVSLRRRLLLYLSSGLLSLWVLSAVGSIMVTLHEINEMADSHMAQLANTLQHVSTYTPRHHTLSDIERILPNNHGNAQSKYNGFAVWDTHGQLLMADRRGQAIPFRQTSGFFNQGSLWQRNSWRYVYIYQPDSGRTVAVCQSLNERLSTLTNVLWVQLALTLMLLPVLLWLIAYGIQRGLQPLTQLGNELSQRDAHNLQAVDESVPTEAQALVQALNQLLKRVDSTLQRERRFTADAAHELRSPLAALKVHTEILAMSEDPQESQHHLTHIQVGIERASRLTEQLLVLSRLDPLEALPDSQSIDWNHLVHQVLQSVNLAAREKYIKLKLDCPCGLTHALPMMGNPVLLQLMLRNLLDNAIRYSPSHTQVTLHLTPAQISVCDQGAGIANEDLPRIKERFYRPAGQSETGSGLGLSIVERIADLHGLTMTLCNQPSGGLCVTLTNQSQIG